MTLANCTEIFELDHRLTGFKCRHAPMRARADGVWLGGCIYASKIRDRHCANVWDHESHDDVMK